MRRKTKWRRPGDWVLHLVWMLLLLLPPAACRSDDARGERPREAMRVTEAPVGAPSAGEIRSALLAVEYWSDPERPTLPDELRPISLEEAAGILVRDAAQGPFGVSRRNRAIIELTVRGLSLADGEPVHAHRRALEILGAPLDQIDALIRKIVRDFPTQPGSAAPPVDPFELLAWLRKQLAPALSQEIAALAPLSVGSCSLIGTPDTSAQMEWSDPWGSKTMSSCSLSPPSDVVVVAKTYVVVSRNFGELSPLMDPQNWDAPAMPAGLCEVYFEKTEVVEQNAGGGWDPVTCPPTPGSEWSKPLEEHYRMSWSPWSTLLETRVQVILNIATDLDPDTTPEKFRADYSLNPYCSTKNLHCSATIGTDTRGGIDVDEGHTQVLPDGSNIADRHQVQSEKRVRFVGWKDPASPGNPYPTDSSPYYNALACYSLEAMGNALQEFVCCDVPAPPVCSTPPGAPVLVP